MKRLFKTDGIRGRFNEDITLDLAYKVGYALNVIGKLIIIGYDTRYSSLDLSNEVNKGVKCGGGNGVILGLCSTPKLAYYSRLFKCVGVMITASHNPAIDNGIKVFKCGEKLTKYEEDKIEEEIKIMSLYEEELSMFLDNPKDNVGLDGAHGGASKILKKVFVGDNFHLINCDYNGYDINDRCGALFPEVIRDYVLKNHLDYGFCFDGDADRIIACDHEGNILNGDYLAYLIASFYNYSKVVLTKMSNLGIINAFKEKGIEVILCDSGDKNVLDTMNKYNVSLGAEASGHIINLKYGNVGDGVLNAIDIINILRKSSRNMNDYYKDINLYPNELRNYNIKLSKEKLNQLEEKLLNQFKDIYAYMRISGTEKCIRVFLQSTDENILNKAFLFLEDEICKL